MFLCVFFFLPVFLLHRRRIFFLVVRVDSFWQLLFFISSLFPHSKRPLKTSSLFRMSSLPLYFLLFFFLNPLVLFFCLSVCSRLLSPFSALFKFSFFFVFCRLFVVSNQKPFHMFFAYFVSLYTSAKLSFSVFFCTSPSKYSVLSVSSFCWALFLTFCLSVFCLFQCLENLFLVFCCFFWLSFMVFFFNSFYKKNRFSFFFYSHALMYPKRFWFFQKIGEVTSSSFLSVFSFSSFFLFSCDLFKSFCVWNDSFLFWTSFLKFLVKILSLFYSSFITFLFASRKNFSFHRFVQSLGAFVSPFFFHHLFSPFFLHPFYLSSHGSFLLFVSISCSFFFSIAVFCVLSPFFVYFTISVFFFSFFCSLISSFLLFFLNRSFSSSPASVFCYQEINHFCAHFSRRNSCLSFLEPCLLSVVNLLFFFPACVVLFSLCVPCFFLICCVSWNVTFLDFLLSIFLLGSLQKIVVLFLKSFKKYLRFNSLFFCVLLSIVPVHFFMHDPKKNTFLCFQSLFWKISCFLISSFLFAKKIT